MAKEEKEEEEEEIEHYNRSIEISKADIQISISTDDPNENIEYLSKKVDKMLKDHKCTKKEHSYG